MRLPCALALLTLMALAASSASAQATQLVVVTTIANTEANATIATISVEAQDGGGTLDGSYNTTINVSITTGTGTLGGTTTGVVMTSGTATFGNLTIDTVGTKVLTFVDQSGTPLTNGVSNSFNITADRLIITTQPTNTTVSTNINSGTGVIVAARDGNGNTDTTFTANVAVVLSAGTGALSGTTPVAAVNGVATFSDLQINTVGTNKELTFSSAGLTSAVSSLFDITAANVAPVLGAPSGVVDLVTGGADPAFTATCFVGQNMAVTFQATDANGADTLTVTVTRTGGSHATPAAAGFSGTFPAQSVGTSPEAVTLAGTAAAAGTITFTVDVADGNGGTDTYTLAITISAPSITVTAPNGAESWTVGGNQNVTWTSGGVPGNVDIHLSTDSGGTFPIALVLGTPNDGTQSITVPNNPGTTCRVRVRDSATTLILDASNANFTITTAPTITVTAPNGGETLTVGNNFSFTWTSGGSPGNVDILLSTDGGGSFPITLIAATADDGTQSIAVPNNPSATCRVRVEDAATGAIFDTSNANFTIAVPAPAAVTMSAAGNPGNSNASPGSTKTALGFRLAETGGSGNFTVTSVVVDVTTFNNTGGVAVAAITSISLRRGGVLQTINNGGAGWSVVGNVVTVNFTGLSSVVTAGGSGDFTVAISFAGTSVPAPNPRYQAAIAPADVNGGASVTGATVTGGTVTLIEELPDDPLDEDKKDDSCELAAHGTPAWPMLAAGAVLAILALRRRKQA